MTAGQRFRVRAHAKINLVLRVGAVQADGYHPLHTVFQSLALHDTLSVTVRRGPFVLTCSDSEVPVDEGNLVTRAARQLWQVLGRTGEPRGVGIEISKQIPMRAGLGGGSSDAAAALVALERVWQPKGASVDRASIAARIGADVPFFLVGGTALGLARGDDLYPLDDLTASWVVLGFPGFGVSTSQAYAWFDDDRSRGAGRTPSTTSSIDAWPGRTLEVTNDLEAPVSRRHPEIARIRDVLSATGARAAAMTGSGSAVFGLFDSRARAGRAARAVAEAGFVALINHTVDRRTCQRVHFSFASSSPRHA
jgi:4-diphosphocytidyl-2-C-methyl-D-erythritol kinase